MAEPWASHDLVEVTMLREWEKREKRQNNNDDDDDDDDDKQIDK